MRFVLVALFLCMALHGFSQPYLSVAGRFQVDQIKGCAPLTIQVAIVPPVTCASGCDISFDGVTFQTFTTSHTYTAPGTYTLRLLVTTLGLDEITITVLPNVQPAAEISLCSGNKTQVKVTDTQYNQYVIQYSDGSPDVVKPSGSLATDTHTFAGSGSQTIQVRGRNLGAADNCAASVYTVSVINSLPPPSLNQAEVISDQETQLQFSATANVQYKLEISQNSPTAFQLVRTKPSTGVETISSLRNNTSYYCFRTGTFDPCLISTAYSATLCTVVPAVTATNNNNRVSWTTSNAGVASYTIERTPTPGLSAASTATFVDDTQVSCGELYCYRVIANYGAGRQTLSATVCVTASFIGTPSAVENISILPAETGYSLLWDSGVQAANYSIYRVIDGSSALAGESTTPTFNDPASGACYRITYTDLCGNLAASSGVVCPLLLSGSIQSDQSVLLQWDDYTGWKLGVDSYLVEKLTDDGTSLGVFDPGTVQQFLDPETDFIHQVVRYRLVARAVDGALPELNSNEIRIVRKPNLYAPGAFTPNGDTLNDTFKVFGRYTVRVELQIFNRWGELLYSSDDINGGWDGTFKGNNMPEGTYVYRAKLTDQLGIEYEKAGTIVLLKK